MQNKYQEKFGYPVERSTGKVKSQMAPWVQEFIGKSPFCVLATSNANAEKSATKACCCTSAICQFC